MAVINYPIITIVEVEIMRYSNDSIPVITDEQRNELYESVWSTPIKELSIKYGISDTTLRKRCSHYGIPLPYAGYWAKKNYGKLARITPLPPVDNNSKRYVSEYHLKFIPDIDKFNYDELSCIKPLDILSKFSKTLLETQIKSTSSITEEKSYHEYIKRHVKDKENIILKEAALNKLSPTSLKRRASIEEKYPNKGEQLPVFCSDSNEPQVFLFLTKLFFIVEYFEGTIMPFSSFNDNEYAYFHLMGTYFDFRIEEKNKQLIFKIKPTYSFTDYDWKEKEYNESLNRPINQMFESIIMFIFEIACMDLIYGYKKKIEEEWERLDRIRQHNLEKLRKGEYKVFEDFCKLATDWDKTKKLTQFKNEIVNSAPESIKSSQHFQQYIRSIESYISWLDPLNDHFDEELGQSKSVYQLIQYINISKDH